MNIEFKDLKKIIDNYKDSEHPINEVLSALEDNIWWEFFDDDNPSNSSSAKAESFNKDYEVNQK